MIVAMALGGCQSMIVSEAIDPAKALKGPYALRLLLDRNSASPGDIVYVTVEFENTGGSDLWIPRRRELFFGYEQRSAFGSSSSESFTSSCDGLEFVRVKPGRKVAYEKGFVVPAIDGEISIYTTASRKTMVPLLVKPRGSNQASKPATSTGGGRALTVD